MPKGLDHYLFDFDGTISDSAEGILNSYLYALESMGIKEAEPDKIRREIGAPLSVTFRDLYGMDDETVTHAIHKLREYYSEHGIYQNSMYPGIPEMLEKLAATGTQLHIATAKPTPYARKIVENYGIREFFTEVEGSPLDGDILEKQLVIANLRELLPAHDTGRMAMIGDSKYDILGGQQHGM